VSAAVCRRFAHRTLLHSIAGLMLATGIVRSLLWLGQAAGLWTGGGHLTLVAEFYACGFLSHLLLDTTTKRGVPYFWPLLKNPLGYPSFEEDRISSGDGRWELIISLASLALFGLLLPVIRHGADITLANVVGQFPQLRQVYTTAVGREVAVQFDGYWVMDKAPVSGEALILAESAEGFTIYLDGGVFQLGEASGDIRLLSGTVRVLELAPQVRTVRFLAATIAAILAAIAPADQVLLSGGLDADRPFTVQRPFNEQVIRVSAKRLDLAFASGPDIAALGVRSGSAAEGLSGLEQKLAELRVLGDSLVATRARSADLYLRTRQLERIKATRQARAQLEELLNERAQADSVVRFSGHLAVRQVPRF